VLRGLARFLIHDSDSRFGTAFDEVFRPTTNERRGARGREMTILGDRGFP
jgi:hypothetical protein